MRHVQLTEGIPDGIDLDPKVLGPFLQGRVGMLGDILLQGHAIQLPSPGAMLLGGSIGAIAPIVDTPATHAKSTSSFRLTTPFLPKLNHPFSQIDAVGHSGQQHT